MNKNPIPTSEKSIYFPKELFINYMNMKQLEYKLINTCMSSCLDLDQPIFSDQEKECLSTCSKNINAFFKISSKNFEDSQRILNSKVLQDNKKRNTTDNL